MEKKNKGIKVFAIIMGLFFMGCVGAAVLMATGTIKVPTTSNESTTEEVSEEYFYKPAVEEYITTFLGLSNPNFSMLNYREWDDGAGFIMVENTFEIDNVEHTYLARVGKDNVIYKLTIDGEVVFSADADALMEYMEEYPVE